MAETRVAFAESAVAVHVARVSEPGLLPDGTEAWDVDSKVLHPGEFIPLSQMPKYLADAVKKNEVPGLRLMTQAAAKRTVEAWNSVQGSPAAMEDLETEEDPEFPVEEI